MSAKSVSACVVRITGQTPPMSARAMSSAASAFMRRRSAHCIGLILGRAGGLARLRQQRREVLIGIGIKKRQQSIRLDTGEFPEIRRTIGEAEQQGVKLGRVSQPLLQRLAGSAAADVLQPLG